MIDQRALDLQDTDGFIEAYYKYVRDGKSCGEAFSLLNHEYREYFGKYKYSTYRSFATVRDRRQQS